MHVTSNNRIIKYKKNKKLLKERLRSYRKLFQKNNTIRLYNSYNLSKFFTRIKFFKKFYFKKKNIKIRLPAIINKLTK